MKSDGKPEHDPTACYQADGTPEIDPQRYQSADISWLAIELADRLSDEFDVGHLECAEFTTDFQRCKLSTLAEFVRPFLELAARITASSTKR